LVVVETWVGGKKKKDKKGGEKKKGVGGMTIAPW